MSLMHVVLLNPPEDQADLLQRIDDAITERGARRLDDPVREDPQTLSWPIPPDVPVSLYSVHVEP